MSGTFQTQSQQSAAFPVSVFGNASGGLLAGEMRLTRGRMDGYVRRGVVTLVNPGLHGIIVSLDDNTTVSCIPPDFSSSALYGVGSASSGIIVPGTPVIVMQPKPGGGTGAILAVLSHQNDDKKADLPTFKSDTGAGMDYSQESAYKTDTNRGRYKFTGVGIYRISDTYPGDWMVSNEFGLAYFLGRTRLTIRGSEMSRIDLMPIDDVFRVAAGYFQMYTHGGKTAVFSDNAGFVSKEVSFSPYVWETGGCKTADDFDSKIKPPEDDSKQPRSLDNDDLARYHEFMGSIAGGRQIFISYPKNGKHRGLAHVALSDSGALVFRSTSDIVFSKTDRIDVPVRIRAPEDPKGEDVPEIAAKDEEPPDEDWWDHDISRRTASNIIKQLYKRFKSNKKDWRIDSEKAEKEYDENVDSIADVGGGASQIVLGHDGSIVLSTSKGAEIRLQGEDITISCPGKLSLRSGEDTYVLSNNDIIAKAKNDCEILSRRDITVSAEKRISEFAGTSIFEEVGNSKKSSDSYADDHGMSTPGIYMKVAEKKGAIVTDADSVYVHPRKQMNVLSVDSNGKTKKTSRLKLGIGMIQAAAFNVQVSAGSGNSCKSGLMLSSGSAWLFGSNAGVAGSSLPSVIGGGKTYMPTGGGGSGPYSSLCSAMRDMRTEILFKKDDLLSEIPYFAYRDYSDADGNAPEIEESTWVNIKRSGRKWGNDMEVNKTLPWPGKDGKCITYRADYRKLMSNDDDFGDKESPKGKPDKKEEKFSSYKG